MLLSRGAGREAADEAGLTPLLWAAREGRPAMVSVLQRAGCLLEAADAGGWTALMHAAAGGHAECVAALLARGAARDVTAADGRSAADVAASEEVAAALEGRRAQAEPAPRREKGRGGQAPLSAGTRYKLVQERA